MNLPGAGPLEDVLVALDGDDVLDEVGLADVVLATPAVVLRDVRAVGGVVAHEQLERVWGWRGVDLGNEHKRGHICQEGSEDDLSQRPKPTAGVWSYEKSKFMWSLSLVRRLVQLKDPV